MRDAERENLFVDTFVAPARRDRYKLLLANAKKRHEILDRLNHRFDFLPSLAEEISGSQNSVEGILRLLQQRGIKETDIVYVLSDIQDLDGLYLPLRQAIEEVQREQFASIVCCLPGRLAYHRAEAPTNGSLLETPPVRSQRNTR